MTVEEHTIELHDGRIIHDWPWVITPDYVIVLARTIEGLFLCFRQTKYGIEGTSLAPVGGHVEPGEDPGNAAERELLEETGYRAEAWTSLGQFRVNGNSGAGMANLYFADRAEKLAEPHSDDLEEQELLLLDQEALQEALLTGEFKVLSWTTAVALTMLRLQKAEGQFIG